MPIEAFNKSEKMGAIRKDLQDKANQGEFQHIILFADLKDLDESVMIFRLLTQGGYLVGSHEKGMLVKW